MTKLLTRTASLCLAVSVGCITINDYSTQIAACISTGHFSVDVCTDFVGQCIEAGNDEADCIINPENPDDGPPSSYVIGGNVIGLDGTVELTEVVGGQTKTISDIGTYTFPDVIEEGELYDVQVSTQPVGQDCAVTNPTGTVATSQVTNIDLDCAVPPVMPYFRYAFEDAYDAGDPHLGIRDTGIWGTMHPTMATAAGNTVDASDFVTGSTPGSMALRMDAPPYTGTNHDYVKVRSIDGHTQILDLKANGLTVRSTFRVSQLGEWTHLETDPTIILNQDNTTATLLSVNGANADTEVIVNIYAQMGGRLDIILNTSRGTSYNPLASLDPNAIGIEIGDGDDFRSIATKEVKIDNSNWNDLYLSITQNQILVVLNGVLETINLNDLDPLPSPVVPSNYTALGTSEIFVGVKKNIAGEYVRNFRGTVDNICIWDAAVDIDDAVCE